MFLLASGESKTTFHVPLPSISTTKDLYSAILKLMGSLYVIIASVALYALMVRTSSTRNINPVFATIVVVIIPLIFEKILWYIYLTGYDLPLGQLISLSDITVTLVQLVVAFIVFYKLQQTEDSIESWLFCGVAGMVSIYFVTPYLVRLVIPA